MQMAKAGVGAVVHGFTSSLKCKSRTKLSNDLLTLPVSVLGLAS